MTLFPWATPIIKPLAQRFPDSLSKRVCTFLQIACSIDAFELSNVSCMEWGTLF